MWNEYLVFNGEFIVNGEGSVCCLSWYDDISLIELKVNFISCEVFIVDYCDSE